MVGASSSIFGCSSSWRKYGGAIEGENQKKKKKKKKKNMAEHLWRITNYLRKIGEPKKELPNRDLHKFSKIKK